MLNFIKKIVPELSIGFICMMLLTVFHFKTKPMSFYVEPVMKGDRRIATSFIVSYAHKQFTVTNRHVCESFEGAYQGGDINIAGRVETIIAITLDSDLCLVTYSGDKKDGLRLETSLIDNLDELTVFGYAGGGDLIKSQGTHRDYQFNQYPWIFQVTDNTDPQLVQIMAMFGIQLEGVIYPKVHVGEMWLACQGGCSGSPVIHGSKVIGVLFAGVPSVPHDTSYIPASKLEELIIKHFGSL